MQEQASALVDSLRIAGFDRKDMIISDLAEEPTWDNVEEATRQGIALVTTERESIRVGDTGTFAEGIEGLKGDQGIIVAVKTSKHNANRVRSMMEQSGAVEIVQD